jgi:hypothetical protein
VFSDVALGKQTIRRVFSDVALDFIFSPFPLRHGYFFLLRAKLHTSNSLPSAREKTLGKAGFADTFFGEWFSPSVTLGDRFTECFLGFAECLRHSAFTLFPVVDRIHSFDASGLFFLF